MLGIDDPGIYMGYILTIIGVIACIIYGVINWNKGMETDIDEIQKDLDLEDKDEQTKTEI